MLTPQIPITEINESVFKISEATNSVSIDYLSIPGAVAFLFIPQCPVKPCGNLFESSVLIS